MPLHLVLDPCSLWGLSISIVAVINGFGSEGSSIWRSGKAQQNQRLLACNLWEGWISLSWLFLSIYLTHKISSGLIVDYFLFGWQPKHMANVFGEGKWKTLAKEKHMAVAKGFNTC